MKKKPAEMILAAIGMFGSLGILGLTLARDTQLIDVVVIDTLIIVISILGVLILGTFFYLANQGS